MIELNLAASSNEQSAIKEFLQNNASVTLAEKINNGVPILKDGTTLINKKSLDSFMTYACDEAKKLAEQGAKFACVHSDTVFNWAIHYFEEDSIEGVLYNEDGTEFKPTITNKSNLRQPIPTPTPQPKPKPQMSLFDFMEMPKENTPPKMQPDTNEPVEVKGENILEPYSQNEMDEPSLIQISESEYVDSNGVIYKTNVEQKNNSIFEKLTELIGNNIIVR